MDLFDEIMGAVIGLGGLASVLGVGALAHYSITGSKRYAGRLPSFVRHVLGLS